MAAHTGSADTPKPGKAGRPGGGNRDPSATVRCRCCGRHGLVGVLQARVVQIGHRAGVAAQCRQPSRPPRQSPASVNLVARSFTGGAAFHHPLGPPQPCQFRRQRPGALLQILQVSAAVERPLGDAAGPTAPITGLRGARTGVVGLRPTGTGCGPCRILSRAGWRSPQAGGSSGHSRGVTALGLVAGLRRTHQAGGHGQVGAASQFHRTPRRGLAGHGLGPAGDSKSQRPSHPPPWRLRRPVMSRPARVGANNAGNRLLDCSLGAMTWPCRQ